MSDPATQVDGQNGRLTIFEVVPAFVSIAIGFSVGKFVACKSGFLVWGILAGILAIPISFVLVAYGLLLAVIVLIFWIPSVLNRTSPRDEYFDDPA